MTDEIMAKAAAANGGCEPGYIGILLDGFGGDVKRCGKAARRMFKGEHRLSPKNLSLALVRFRVPTPEEENARTLRKLVKKLLKRLR